MDDEHHFGMPGGSEEYEDEDDKRDVSDAFPTASWRQWPVTEQERHDLGTSGVDRNKGDEGDDSYADEEEEASQADDGSMQIVEVPGHGRFDLGTSDVDSCECEDGDDLEAEAVG